MRFDTFPFSPRLTQARWTLGKLASEDMPWLAQEALSLGYDGRATRRLAGMMNPVKADIEPFLKDFFAELGLPENLSQTGGTDTGVLCRGSDNWWPRRGLRGS